MVLLKLRRPSLMECVFGLWMGAVVVFMPVAYRRLLQGVSDPAINWWLLVVIWLAGSAAFAVAAGFLFQRPRAWAAKPGPDGAAAGEAVRRDGGASRGGSSARSR